jgi:hypothetical protein
MLEADMTITAMKQALEALESCTPADTSTGHVVWPSYDEQAVAQAITALRTAIEQAEKQEPLAWISPSGALYRTRYHALANAEQSLTPLYTHPPQRQWVELTNEEIDKTYETQVWDARRSYARAIEAKLKEKNT